MDSFQVRVSVPRSPAGYSSPPSFGLSASDSDELDTPLHPRVTRMTCHGPWSPRASPITRDPTAKNPSTGSPVSQSPASSSAVTNSRVSGSDKVGSNAGNSAQSPDCDEKTGLNRSVDREADPAPNVQRNIQASFERSPERGRQRSSHGGQERSRNQRLSQERNAEEEPKTSTPRQGSAPTPFTPRAFDKLLHDERQRHLEEAKVSSRRSGAPESYTVALSRRTLNTANSLS